MGDMADMAIDECLDLLDLSLTQAFDAENLDDATSGYTMIHDPQRRSYVTCRCCGVSALRWGKHSRKWRLFDSVGLHRCPVKPLPTDDMK